MKTIPKTALKNSPTLKNLEIDVLPATKIIAVRVHIIQCNGQGFSAQIYEDRDEWVEFVCAMYSLSEENLRNQVIRIYGCEFFSERTPGNFKKWYKKLGGIVSEDQMKKISKKF